MYKILETPRLSIRPISPDDSDFTRRLVNSAGWLRYIGNRNIYTEGDAEKYITQILANKNLSYSVFSLKETGMPAGILTLLNRKDLEFPDLGFAILPEFEKNGYTFEAAKKYLDEIIQSDEYPSISGITLPDNQASIQLLDRLGFRFQKYIERDGKKTALFVI